MLTDLENCWSVLMRIAGKGHDGRRFAATIGAQLIELVSPPQAASITSFERTPLSRLRPTCATFALRAQCPCGGVAQLRSDITQQNLRKC